MLSHRNVRMAGAIAALALAGASHAQNALGDGRGLENNDVSVTRFNNRVNANDMLLDRLRLRNAIVTGNAPGGLSFRGDLGYGAPGEFRGELGANDLFAFRRDSLYSGLTGYGIRGTEAMQWQFALTTDAQAPRGLLGAPTVRRFGAQDLRTPVVDQENWRPGLNDSDLLRPDPIEGEIEAMRAPGGTLMGSLRSTSAFTAARPSTPTLLSTGQDEAGRRLGLTASALEGVRLQELELPDWMTAEAAGGPGSPDRPQTDLRINPQSTSERVSPTRTAYDEVLERLRSAATPIVPEAPEDVQKPLWQQRLEEIRERLAPGAGESDEEFSEESLELIRRAGGRADSLIAEGAKGLDPYGEHLRRAQNLLSEGQYFDAEERFTRAMSMRADDVAAQVGRMHSQLGAGMYLSASINLRSLVRENPEVAGVRYGPRLLPATERLSQIVETLRENARGEGSPTLQRESALLLAYLGSQTGNPSLVSEGLETFEAQAAPDDQRLVNLLRGVWLPPRTTPERDDSGR